MDWRVLGSTFVAIFLAEIGDKTQLTAITMAASTGRPFSVFAGASLALAAVSAVGVAFGAGFGSTLPLEWIKRVAALVFIAIGLLMLSGKL